MQRIYITMVFTEGGSPIRSTYIWHKMRGWKCSLQVSVLERLEWHQRGRRCNSTSQRVAEGQGWKKRGHYCITYICMSGNGVVALDGISLSTGKDHRATHLGFGAVRYGCSFGRGLKRKYIYLLTNSKTV